MLIARRVLALFLFSAVLASCAVLTLSSASASQGRLSNSDGSVKNCTGKHLCCRVGRKAARHHVFAPLYTCSYEALLAGIQHQTSVANRLRSSKGSFMINMARRTSAFRYRMSLCYRKAYKACFESCCIAKRKRMHRKAASKAAATTPKKQQN